MLLPQDLKDLNLYLKQKNVYNMAEKVQKESRTLKSKVINGVRTVFFDNSYFERLFPSIRE